MNRYTLRIAVCVMPALFAVYGCSAQDRKLLNTFWSEWRPESSTSCARDYFKLILPAADNDYRLPDLESFTSPKEARAMVRFLEETKKYAKTRPSEECDEFCYDLYAHYPTLWKPRHTYSGKIGLGRYQCSIFSPDAAYLAVADYEHGIRIISLADMSEYKRTQELACHNILGLDFDIAQEMLIIVSTLRVWTWHYNDANKPVTRLDISEEAFADKEKWITYFSYSPQNKIAALSIGKKKLMFMNVLRECAINTSGGMRDCREYPVKASIIAHDADKVLWVDSNGHVCPGRVGADLHFQRKGLRIAYKDPVEKILFIDGDHALVCTPKMLGVFFANKTSMELKQSRKAIADIVKGTQGRYATIFSDGSVNVWYMDISYDREKKEYTVSRHTLATFHLAMPVKYVPSVVFKPDCSALFFFDSWGDLRKVSLFSDRDAIAADRIRQLPSDFFAQQVLDALLEPANSLVRAHEECQMRRINGQFYALALDSYSDTDEEDDISDALSATSSSADQEAVNMHQAEHDLLRITTDATESFDETLMVLISLLEKASLE